MDRNMKEKTVAYKLEYGTFSGWARTINLNGKFQWARVKNTKLGQTKKGLNQNSVAKRLHQNAYIRQVKSENISLIPAQDAFMDGSVMSSHSQKPLASFADILSTQSKPLSKKLVWFHSICAKLHDTSSQISKCIHIPIRRKYVLEDSMAVILSMNPTELHKKWIFTFANEEGIDAGGITREWFHLISTIMLDVASGCWKGGGGNQMHLQIHPFYSVSCSDYQLYFRFLGRIMGKALLDSQLISNGHFVPYLYKMILGWPITFSDLQALDAAYYNSLLHLTEMDEDLLTSQACLDFTVVENVMGDVRVVELKEGGKHMNVKKENLLEFLELILEYRLVKRVKDPLRELLIGFYDVIPESLLTIFDVQELELLLCGLPNIDVDDWMYNTEYSGLYIGDESHHVCMWFWEIVREMNEELRARLLQYVTGTAGVPSKGFSELQGSDGDIRKFSIHGIELKHCLYPRAHTCFNRIDLPIYESKDDLKEKLEFVISLVSTGFDLE